MVTLTNILSPGFSLGYNRRKKDRFNERNTGNQVQLTNEELNAQNQQRSFDYAGQSDPTIASGKDPADLLQARINDQLLAARSRYNRLGTQSGATAADLQRAVNPLADQLGALDGQQNALKGLTGQLISSSLGSTAGASVAAVNAARMSGDGRYGSGGNAAQAASRGAVDAAVNQSAALSSAIIQGRTAEASYQSNILQQRGGVASALSALLQQQAGLKEQRGQLGVAMEQQFADTLGQSQSVYGDIAVGMKANKKTWKDKAPGLLGII